MKVCKHCFVSGVVQGVWFRSYTQKEASRLNLTGWVRNLRDGRVEVLFCGEQQNVAHLQTWLHQGPTLAKVDNVECKQLESVHDFTSFEII